MSEREQRKLMLLRLKKTNRKRFQEEARAFYDERREWVKQGISIARDYEEDKGKEWRGKAVAKALARAKQHDEDFLYLFGSTPLKILSFWSFVEIANFEITGTEYPSVKAQRKESADDKIERQKQKRGRKFAGALEAGALPAERGLGFAAFCDRSSPQPDVIDNVELEGKRLDARLFMMLDCAAKKFLTLLYAEEIKRKEVIKSSAFARSASELVKTAEVLEDIWLEKKLPNIKDYAVDISLTLEEMKKITGRNIKNEEFYKIAKLLGYVIINKIVMYYDEEREAATDGAHYFSKIETRSETLLQFVSPEILTTTRKMRGRGAEKKEYKVILRFWSRGGLAFLSNVKALKFDLLPKRFYKLSYKAQELFRAIVWKPKDCIALTITEISRILGWKEVDKVKWIQDRIKAIERICEELTRNRFLYLWESRLSGKQTKFMLFKCKDAEVYLKAKEERAELSEFLNEKKTALKLRQTEREEARHIKKLVESFKKK
jgi:hypothetical protein